MERRGFWAWLGGGAGLLGGIGLAVAKLMAEAEPLAYWTVVAMCAACFVFGAVALYVVNRHRILDKASATGGWHRRDDGPTTDSGPPGWWIQLVAKRELPRFVTVVADEAIVKARATCDCGGPPNKGEPARTRPHVMVFEFTGVERFNVGDSIRIEVRGHRPLRIATTKPRRKPPRN